MGISLGHCIPYDFRALFHSASVYSAMCGVIHVCEKAVLVSQTLNSALALIIISTNLWPLLVINDAAAAAAADSFHRRAQISP